MFCNKNSQSEISKLKYLCFVHLTKDCPHQAVFCMQIGYFCGTGVAVGTTVLAVMYFAAA